MNLSLTIQPYDKFLSQNEALYSLHLKILLQSSSIHASQRGLRVLENPSEVFDYMCVIEMGVVYSVQSVRRVALLLAEIVFAARALSMSRAYSSSRCKTVVAELAFSNIYNQFEGILYYGKFDTAGGLSIEHL